MLCFSKCLKYIANSKQISDMLLGKSFIEGIFTKGEVVRTDDSRSRGRGFKFRHIMDGKLLQCNWNENGEN